jgi:hypothetical protein
MSKAESVVRIGSVGIPLRDFVVSRTGILGITKSGKTYGAKGIAEQLMDAEVPIIVFDAIGVWRHLKYPNGPGGRGYPMVIAGGATPDLPLSPDSAPEIVRAAIRENISLVIDLYDPHLSKADWRRIVQRCFRTLLYENKGRRHIFLEESPEYIPQRVIDQETYAEVEKLARMGGNHSLGLTIIAQRSQEVNKAVLELCDNLVLLRQRGSKAIENLEKWLDRVSPDRAREITKALPHMTQGDCWVWAEASEEPVRTRTAALRSFHPDRRDAAKVSVAAAGKPVDTKVFVERLSGKLADLVEKAKADDPKELRRQIAQLERELAAVKKAAPVAEVREVPVLTKEQVAVLNRVEECFGWFEEARSDIARAEQAVLEASRHFGELKAQIAVTTARPVATTCTVPARAETRRAVAKMVQHAAKAATNGHKPPAPPPDGPLTGPEQRILDAIAWLEDTGVAEPEQTAVAFLADYTYGAGSFNNPKGRLRARGFIDYLPQNRIRLTEAGRPHANHPTAPLTAEEMHAHVLGRLPGPEQRVLRPLLAAYPNKMAKDELAEAAGYTPGAGSFNNPCGRLRTLGLIDYPEPGYAVARGILFLEFS